MFVVTIVVATSRIQKMMKICDRKRKVCNEPYKEWIWFTIDALGSPIRTLQIGDVPLLCLPYILQVHMIAFAKRSISSHVRTPIQKAQVPRLFGEF